jgi:hypothetical protein
MNGGDMISRVDEPHSDRAERIFADLVTKWDYLRFSPQQALEEIHAAAAINLSVDLSPDGAMALAAMVDGEHTPRIIDGHPSAGLSGVTCGTLPQGGLHNTHRSRPRQPATSDYKYVPPAKV